MEIKTRLEKSTLLQSNCSKLTFCNQLNKHSSFWYHFEQWQIQKKDLKASPCVAVEELT